MAEQFSRRSFLKGGALTAGAFALGGLFRVDTAMAAPQEKARSFLRRTSASKD
ncbi:twin-arginine translocation signal domain-containing protein [Bilophila wadsworthia]